MSLNMKTQAPSVQKGSRSAVRVPGQPRRCVCVAAQASSTPAVITRRQVLNATALSVGSLTVLPQLPALAARAPAGFSVGEDLNDGYTFLYPFGWQEIAVKGADIVYKDVIEPLETVSVTITDTPKQDITEFGDIATVCDTLARSVLTAPGQDVKVVNTSERTDDKGRKYYEFEFTATNPRYARHQVAVVAVSGGRFFTLTTGASEKRWGKMKDKLITSMHSFTLQK